MISRRELLLVAVGGCAAYGQNGPLTAGQVVERIQKQVGVPWRAQTVDTIKTGSPDAAVKGIATSMVASFDVLKRAAADGKNMLIVHEPTFYNHHDETTDVSGDAIYAEKRKFIDANGIVIFRFHDHWHARRPDGIRTGMIAALGWEKYISPENPRLYNIPATTLAKAAGEIRDRMKIRGLRVVGDPATPVRTVVLSPGATNLRAVMRSRPDADLYIFGETTEWQSIEYARDAMDMGRKFGVIAMGHVISEEEGMAECARWLKTFIPEVPVGFIAAREPFWSPQ